MPDVAYARVGEARVAYQVHGAGDLDIVYSPGLASHLDLTLEQPRYRSYIEELTRLGRVIRFDRRGAGLSDPMPPEAGESWEQWTDDLDAVLDDLGSRNAAIIATNDAGPAAILFAALHPARVRSLVLFNTTARFTATEGYPQGHPAEVAQLVVDVLREAWGTEAGVELLAPSLAGDEPFRRWYSRFQRGASSPGVMADNLSRLFDMDGRHLLPEVRCPTLVLHRSGYTTVNVEQARYLADRIPGAQFGEVPGTDAPLYTQHMSEIVGQIGTFLGGSPSPPLDDRVFSTVLFTDIVGSTEQAVALGDHRWRTLLDEHDSAARAAVDAHGGRSIKSTGDGLLATFDAPTRAIRCAVALRGSVASLGLEMRAGLHAGPLVRRPDGDISGVAVHVAARVLGQAAPGEILVSGAVADLAVDVAHSMEDRGVHELKGLPEPHRILAVT